MTWLDELLGIPSTEDAMKTKFASAGEPTTPPQSHKSGTAGAIT